MTTARATALADRIDWDVVEKLGVATLLGLFAVRLLPSVIEHGAYLNLHLILVEALSVFFVLTRRRSTDISRRGVDWVLGFGGTVASLLVVPASGDPVIPIAYCAAIMTTGFVIQFGAKLSLRRSFGIIAANRGVKASGLYRVVRHPMYAGYVLTHVGFLLSGPNAWNAGLYGLAFMLFIVRIQAEERVLIDDPAYVALTKAVRYKLIPLIY